MEITLNDKGYGYYIEITAENVNISEDIEIRNYEKDENGKAMYDKYTCDIDTNYIDMISELLWNMIYYRKGKYDSSDLIKELFSKLPENKITEIMCILNERYPQD